MSYYRDLVTSFSVKTYIDQTLTSYILDFDTMGDAAVNLVRAIVSYIQQRSTTMTGPSLDRLISSQCQACVSHLRGSDLSHDDANQILGVLREERCLFNTEQVDTISAVLDEKLTYTTSASHQPRVSSKPHQQTHNHLRNYLTEYMWQAIYSHASISFLIRAMFCVLRTNIASSKLQ